MRSQSLLVLLSLLCPLGLIGSGCVEFGECSQNSDCAASYGPHYQCVEQICEPVEPQSFYQAGCFYSYGDITAPNREVIGVITPLSGLEDTLTLHSLMGMELAIDELNAWGVFGDRSFALLVCDSGKRADRSVEMTKAFEYLEQTIGAKAVVSLSNQFRSKALIRSLRADSPVAMISPTLTLSSFRDDAHFYKWWSSTTSTLVEAEPLRLLWEQEVKRRNSWALLRNLNSGDARELFDEIFFSYYAGGALQNDWESGTIAYESENGLGLLAANQQVDGRMTILDELMHRKPKYMMIFDAANAWKIIEAYAPIAKMEYGREFRIILTSRSRLPEAIPETLRDYEDNIMGISLPFVPVEDKTYRVFAERFEDKYNTSPDISIYPAKSYDAIYALALSSVGKPFTAIEIHQGFDLMTSTSESIVKNILPLDEGGLNEIAKLRASNQPFGFLGASGPFTFAEAKILSHQPQPVLWCVRDGRIVETSLFVEQAVDACSQLPKNTKPDEDGDCTMPSPNPDCMKP